MSGVAAVICCQYLKPRKSEPVMATRPFGPCAFSEATVAAMVSKLHVTRSVGIRWGRGQGSSATSSGGPPGRRIADEMAEALRSSWKRSHTWPDWLE